MRKTLFLFTLSLIFLSFTVNAQKQTSAKQVSLDKQVVQKKVESEGKVDMKPSTPQKLTFTKDVRNLDAKATILSESFENGGVVPTGWENDPTNDYDWAFLTSSTSSGGAIAGDNTTGTGYFAYFNSWDANNGDIGMLNSPTIDLSTATVPKLDFYWNRPGNTSNPARLEVNIYANGVWNNDVVAGLDQTTAGWEKITIDLSSYLFNDVKIQFKVVGDWYRNIGLDDVLVYEPDPYQFALTYPTGVEVYAGESHYYTVSIENTGTTVDDFTPARNSVGSWAYELVDASDSATALATPITIAAGDSYNFVVKANVPATGVSMGDTDTESFTVSSAEGSKAEESFDITTTALTLVNPEKIGYTYILWNEADLPNAPAYFDIDYPEYIFPLVESDDAWKARAGEWIDNVWFVNDITTDWSGNITGNRFASYNIETGEKEALFTDLAVVFGTMTYDYSTETMFGTRL
ncbi:MAG: hypothetical protein R6U85_00845, partial [Salinivirgaceae bacterium]